LLLFPIGGVSEKPTDRLVLASLICSNDLKERDVVSLLNLERSLISSFAIKYLSSRHPRKEQMKFSLPCPPNPGLFSSAFPLFTALLSPILALLAAVPQSAANPPWAPLPTYNVTDLWLGAVGAINNLGEIAGTNYTVTVPILGGRAVLCKGGERIYLDTLLGLPVGGIPENYLRPLQLILQAK
jgi:hypothetical protein